MPRKYLKTTIRVHTSLDVLRRASQAVANGGNYSQVAKGFNIDRMKLKRFIKREQSEGPQNVSGYERLSQLKCTFNQLQEDDLAKNISRLFLTNTTDLVSSNAENWHTNSLLGTT